LKDHLLSVASLAAEISSVVAVLDQVHVSRSFLRR